MNSKDYRSTLGGVTPSPAWRERTLAAMEQAQGQRRPSRKPLAIAATAAALAVAVTGGVWLSGRTEVDPDGPGVARTPEPVVTPTPTPGMPKVWDESFSFVTNPGNLAANSPSAGRLDELTELPVYENPIPTEEEQRTLLDQWAGILGLTITDVEWTASYGEETMGREPTLRAECADGTKLWLRGMYDLYLYDSPDLTAIHDRALQALVQAAASRSENQAAAPAVYTSKSETYGFDGMARTTWTTVVRDPDAPLEEQIWDTAFQCMESTDSTLRIYLPPAESISTYPLRSEAEAVASFLSGDYWGCHYTSHPDQATVLLVELEYDLTMGQPYFQPVYRILYTQDYWDEVIADWVFDGVDPSPFTGVGVAYVPAIDPEYQDEVPYRRYCNDGLAHMTPADLL